MFKKLLCLVVLVFSMNIMAAEADELLKSLQDKFASINDMSADIKQNIGGNFNGKIYFKKENKFRVELKNSIIISDGETIWNYSKRDNKVIINNVDESDVNTFSLNTFLNEYPSKSTLSAAREGIFQILTLIPKAGSDLNFSKAKLWVNKDNLVEKIRVERTGGSLTEISLTNYRVNQSISDSKFSFTAPEGSSIIDLR